MSGNHYDRLCRVIGQRSRRQTDGEKAANSMAPKGTLADVQARIATLNGELNQYIECWYPRFPVTNDESNDLHEVKLAA